MRKEEMRTQTQTEGHVKTAEMCEWCSQAKEQKHLGPPELGGVSPEHWGECGLADTLISRTEFVTIC